MVSVYNISLQALWVLWCPTFAAVSSCNHHFLDVYRAHLTRALVFFSLHLLVALYLGDIEERVRVLEEVGQLALAYVTAGTAGLNEDAERLRKRIDDAGGKVPALPANAKLMMPPTPILPNQENWPEVEVEGELRLSCSSGINEP